jgi:integral membrane protein
MKLFRLTAFLEGVSYLLLLFAAVPIKYLLGNPLYVKLLGMPHGILFVAYIFFVFYFGKRWSWNLKVIGVALACSVLPFGTFYVDWKYLKDRS